jgi:flagellar basal-body rod protein FlgG
MSDYLTQLEAIARSGIQSHRTGVDVTSHNIANANTTGFKRTRAGFAETLKAQTDTDPEELSGVKVSDTTRLFSQGALEESPYPWNLALTGDGFFAISMPGGQTAYTRDGNFRIDAQGTLVTAAGYRLQANVRLLPGVEQVTFNPNGTVSGIMGDGTTVPMGIIPVTRFADPGGLLAIGDNLFQATPASGAAEVGVAGQGGSGEIQQGMLERSNVDMGEEMVNLIMAQRAYTLATKTLQNADEMWSMTNNLRK